jgi:proteasome lid subunit RPN8/RPN11
MSIISSEELINNILFERKEICGYIKLKEDGQHYFIKTADGPIMIDSDEKKSRGSCNIGKNYPHIWHTHPKCSKYYPSSEDILKVIKHKSIITSHIFVAYGYWILNSEIINPEIIIDEKRIQYYINMISKTFYFITNKGRDYNNIAINTFINDLNKYLNDELNINFSINWVDY